MRVDTTIADSRLVVFIGPGHYIDVRKDRRDDRCEIAEVVQRGHVVERVALPRCKEPETIIKLMRKYKR